MDDLRRHFATLDAVTVPDLRVEIDRRAAMLAFGSVHGVTATVRPMRRPARGSTTRSLVLVLATASVVLALVAGAIAVGSGLVKWPAITPAPSTSAPVPASPSPSSSAFRWLTGRQLMDSLSADFGYQWQRVELGPPQYLYLSESPASVGTVIIRISQPLVGPAMVEVAASMDVNLEEIALHVDRVSRSLAPDAAAWLEEAMAQGLTAEAAFASAMDTASGGHVGVAVVREEQIGDWILAWFSRYPRVTSPR